MVILLLQGVVDDYFSRIKTHVLVERKADWQSCNIVCTAITSLENAMNYSVWVTHRDNWQDMAKPNLARTNLIKFMKTLQVEMNLEFAKICQPVKIIIPDLALSTSNNSINLNLSGNSNSTSSNVDKKDV